MQISYYAPIFLIILSNTCYHLSSKSVPHTINPFISLSIAYFVALTISFSLIFFTKPAGTLFETKDFNIANILLGIAIIGVEGGYILLYRNGWDISKGSLIANITTAIILLLIGIYFYKEHLTPVNILGILICFAGAILINLK